MLRTTFKTSPPSRNGFTLVELAIVMIIIGLLIGGILKGQELVESARVTATVSQVKGIEAAIATFQDKYNALPGDIINPGLRIPGCAGVALCDVSGNGNGILNAAIVAPPAGEGLQFFVHLALADLITGVNPASPAGVGMWGTAVPASPISGGWWIGSTSGVAADFTCLAGPVIPRAGTYLLSALLEATGQGSLTASQAYRLDAKLDDGVPGSGDVRAAQCDPACGTAAAYAESNQAGGRCNLYIRIH